MRLLIAIGKMLACMVAGCAVLALIFAWVAFCYRLGPLRGLVIAMAPW